MKNSQLSCCKIKVASGSDSLCTIWIFGFLIAGNECPGFQRWKYGLPTRRWMQRVGSLLRCHWRPAKFTHWTSPCSHAGEAGGEEATKSPQRPSPLYILQLISRLATANVPLLESERKKKQRLSVTLDTGRQMRPLYSLFEWWLTKKQDSGWCGILHALVCCS